MPHLHYQPYSTELQQPRDLSSTLYGPQHLPDAEQSQDWKHGPVLLPLSPAPPLCTSGLSTAAADGGRGLLCISSCCWPHAPAYHSTGTAASHPVLPHLRPLVRVHRTAHEATAPSTSEPLPLHFWCAPKSRSACRWRPWPGPPGGFLRMGSACGTEPSSKWTAHVSCHEARQQHHTPVCCVLLTCGQCHVLSSPAAAVAHSCLLPGHTAHWSGCAPVLWQLLAPDHLHLDS
uniref:Uncharacterized protein n=1 Tax=Canis lupus familiaris TaxID=9615 RepID=A0A8C0MT45_CANLF